MRTSAPERAVTGLSPNRTGRASDALDLLLGESVDACRRRESTQLDRIAGDRASSIVLFGAGGLGRRTAAGLRRTGIEPLAFSDNRPELWGSSIDGIAVHPPADAAATFGASAAFVVTIWGAGSSHRFEHTLEQLSGLGCEIVMPISWLSWRYARELLPFYALDLPSNLLVQALDVRRAFDLLDDERSQEEYVSQVRWRLTGDPGCLAHPVTGEQYLVTDVAVPNPDDVVVDCGAYDGDTLRSWLATRGPSFDAYFALEPDPISRSRLERYAANLEGRVAGRVHVLPFSVAGHTGTTSFSAVGSVSSSIDGGDGITVDCIRLDDLTEHLRGCTPTFLKVDIEGAELDALDGGARFIRRARPLIAMAAYHRQDHLWKTLLTVSELWPEYRCFLRPHNEEGWDLILYAVPPDRVPEGGVTGHPW